MSEGKLKAVGYAAKCPDTPLEKFDFERSSPGPKDVLIDILYCGVCHSDLHTAKNDWKGTIYPVVPGHEIIGKVSKVGDEVTKFKVGDSVGVGCLVDSCRSCNYCGKDLEQFCKDSVLTYNASSRTTHGGYSDFIVVSQDFVVKIPDGLDLKSAAPILCAGITSYSPLMHHNVKKGQKVAVVGLGGLGHMGLKLANSLGAEVYLITRSSNKEDDAKRDGAKGVILSTSTEEMAKHTDSFDLILNTIPVGHDVNPYLNLLKIDGTMVMVGAIEPLEPVHGGLLARRKNLTGSIIGGIKETQELLDFCGKHDILCEVEVIKIQDINEAYERMKKGDVKYRFVIDMASLKE